MRRIIFILSFLFLVASITMYAQGGSTLVLDESSFAPVNQDAITGLNIDPIAKDRSNRECARVKIHVTRMTAEDIAGISVRTVGGNILVMRKEIAAGGNGIIVEMTARPGVRFYLHHDIFGESNVVTVDLEGNKEYKIEAWCNLFQTITVACDRIGAGVFLDGRYKGVIGDQGVIVIPDVTTGLHQINVADSSDEASMSIEVTRSNVYFSIALQDSASLQQFVLFRVDPADATVELDGSVLPVNDGTASKMMRFGTYRYRVYAPRYHPAEGTVTVNSTEHRSEVDVILKPAVGVLEITDNQSINGADVYVDDEYIGKAPLTTSRLSSGSHKIRFVKPMYEPYEQYITIYEGKTLTISPELEADFVTVTLKAVPGSEIWVNGVYKGVDSWTGDLAKGACRFEVRKTGHRTAYLSRDLNSTSPITIDLPAPEPVYGQLVIDSTPAMAIVEISGMNPRETPVIISKMLVGTHEVRIKKDGYQDYVTTVTVSEGKTAEIKASLKKGTTSSSTKSSKKLADYIDSARKGDASAQFEAGYCYYNGLGTSVNYTEAVNWYRKAAAQNHSIALNNLGVCYEFGEGVTKNLHEAVRYYKQAAELGSRVAQCNLGYCYTNGIGVTQDHFEAVKWYRKSADQGLPRAQNALGVCYENGRGVQKNLEEAVRWYLKSAENGYATAQCNLGYCYTNGIGVTQDHFEAVKWYRKAAETGYARAQNSLAICYEYGKGVSKNMEEAIKLYRMAAEQDNEYAQFNLGLCYEYGTGLQKDLSEAKKWYQKAADKGYKKALEKLQNL